jgi:hypothetical protein
MAIVRPLPLVPIPDGFDHPDWVFELKHDGFRALEVGEARAVRGTPSAAIGALMTV